jgi:hypothetical protein
MKPIYLVFFVCLLALSCARPVAAQLACFKITPNDRIPGGDYLDWIAENNCGGLIKYHFRPSTIWEGATMECSTSTETVPRNLRPTDFEYDETAVLRTCLKAGDSRLREKDKNEANKDKLQAARQKAYSAQSRQAEYDLRLDQTAKEQAAKIAADQQRVQDNLRRQQLAHVEAEAEEAHKREAEERAAQEEVPAEPDPPQRPVNRGTNGKVCFAGYQDCLHDCMRTTGNEGSAGFCGMCSTQNGENCYRRQ